MVEWWRYRGPPVYVTVAGYFGLIKEKPRAGQPESEIGDLEELVQRAGPGGMIH